MPRPYDDPAASNAIDAVDVGAYERNPSGSIGVGDGAPLRREVWLSRPAPNPSNGAMTFRFSLPAAGPVELAIFAVAGRRLRTLLRGPAAAGPGMAAWDGKDDGGRAVASGVVIARLRTAQGETSRRIVRVR